MSKRLIWESVFQWLAEHKKETKIEWLAKERESHIIYHTAQFSVKNHTEGLMLQGIDRRKWNSLADFKERKLRACKNQRVLRSRNHGQKTRLHIKEEKECTTLNRKDKSQVWTDEEDVARLHFAVAQERRVKKKDWRGCERQDIDCFGRDLEI